MRGDRKWQYLGAVNLLGPESRSTLSCASYPYLARIDLMGSAALRLMSIGTNHRCAGIIPHLFGIIDNWLCGH